jgi:hypothetical protein
VLLCFESARHGDIKNPHLDLAQHLLCTLYPLAQDKLMRAMQRHNGLLRCVLCGRLGRFVEPFPRIFRR